MSHLLNLAECVFAATLAGTVTTICIKSWRTYRRDFREQQQRRAKMKANLQALQKEYRDFRAAQIEVEALLKTPDDQEAKLQSLLRTLRDCQAQATRRPSYYFDGDEAFALGFSSPMPSTPAPHEEPLLPEGRHHMTWPQFS